MTVIHWCLMLSLLAGSGCASAERTRQDPADGPRTHVRGTAIKIALDAALERQILELNPERISGEAVRDLLSRVPAPRIISIHGGIPLVYLAMESFAHFLIAMGYPEDKIRRPKGEAFSYSPYATSSAEIAGMVAWYYENEGSEVILVGHSLGGIHVVQVLHELAGAFTDRVAVWNPRTERAENRFSIIDPFTGLERSVLGLRVGYATAVASGGLGRLLRWQMISRLRSIPDTVEHFTGFYIPLDFIGGDLLGLSEDVNLYRSQGVAKVRNIKLSAFHNHFTVTASKDLALDAKVKDWINSYAPDEKTQIAEGLGVSADDLLWAAEVWHDIKQQWCLEAQRLIRAKGEIDRVSPPVSGDSR